jgi:ATP-dependent DNA helicase MPH1
MDMPKEKPTHHALNHENLQTWVYPTNLGPTRDYQFSIVKSSLFNNTLVALPTGLGKTFIAATVMLNFYRWTKDAKIVFVAPTKPLVAQQVDACFNIAGIARSETTLLTGETAPALRVEEWKSRRIFFMTPQTLLNDLSHGYADPKSIALLVIDEAHRSVGEYAYAKVTKFIRRFSDSIRILALTATPGSKIETVQEVIDNLGISHVEIRTEESLDIRQYVHQRNIEQVILDHSDEIITVRELFTKVLQPLVSKLAKQNIYYGRDTMSLTTYGLVKAQQEWFATSGRHVPQPVQFMMRAIFSILTGIAHSIKLLNFHGIKPFYDNMKEFRNETEERGAKGSKYKQQLIADPDFQEMMTTIDKWLRTDGFMGHPKLTALSDTILNHFMDRGEDSGTRVIVFSEYRDSAEEIVRVLNIHKPLVRATVFVGQADSKRSEGMKQAQQIQTIEKFKTGLYNVLVATSIGEEGLDIGQVDLIICYDASSSPIRMLQRMGRTGRKRAGNIVLLLMRGKEEDQYAKSKDNYMQMQKLICEGSKFNFRFDISTRIMPRDINPQVSMEHIDIPIENTQNNALPEPRKQRRAPKKPPKKFHMPDGVMTGFTTAAAMSGISSAPSRGRPKQKQASEMDSLAEIPSLKSVYLNEKKMSELNRFYRDLPYGDTTVEETTIPSLSSHPALQRSLRPTSILKHGEHTRRCVKLFRKLARYQDPNERFAMPYGELDTSEYLELPVKPFADALQDRADQLQETEEETTENGQRGAKRHRIALLSDDNDSESQFPAKRKKPSTKTRSLPFRLGSQVEEDQSEKSENEGGELPRPKQGRPKKGTKAKARHRSKGKQRTSRGINSDEIGDDCDRDSDMIETDGSDSGGDLLDFVVSDGHLTSSVRRHRSTSPTSLPSSSDVQGVERVGYSHKDGGNRIGKRRTLVSDSDSADE